MYVVIKSLQVHWWAEVRDDKFIVSTFVLTSFLFFTRIKNAQGNFTSTHNDNKIIKWYGNFSDTKSVILYFKKKSIKLKLPFHTHSLLSIHYSNVLQSQYSSQFAPPHWRNRETPYVNLIKLSSSKSYICTMMILAYIHAPLWPQQQLNCQNANPLPSSGCARWTSRWQTWDQPDSISSHSLVARRK